MSLVAYEVTIEWHKWPFADLDKFVITCLPNEDIALKCENEAYKRRVLLNGVVPGIPIITSLRMKNDGLET